MVHRLRLVQAVVELQVVELQDIPVFESKLHPARSRTPALRATARPLVPRFFY